MIRERLGGVGRITSVLVPALRVFTSFANRIEE